MYYNPPCFPNPRQYINNDIIEGKIMLNMYMDLGISIQIPNNIENVNNHVLWVNFMEIILHQYKELINYSTQQEA